MVRRCLPVRNDAGTKVNGGLRCFICKREILADSGSIRIVSSYLEPLRRVHEFLHAQPDQHIGDDFHARLIKPLADFDVPDLPAK